MAILLFLTHSRLILGLFYIFFASLVATSSSVWMERINYAFRQLQTHPLHHNNELIMGISLDCFTLFECYENNYSLKLDAQRVGRPQREETFSFGANWKKIKIKNLDKCFSLCGLCTPPWHKKRLLLPPQSFLCTRVIVNYNKDQDVYITACASDLFLKSWSVWQTQCWSNCPFVSMKKGRLQGYENC